MASSLYLTSAEPRCGKSIISLGILEMLLRKTQKIAIFRPIIGDKKDNEKDQNICLLLEYFNLKQDYESTYAFKRSVVQDLISNERFDEVLDKTIQKYKNLEQSYDFILVIGTDYKKKGSSFEFNLNIELAKNLSCPVLILGRGDNWESIDQAVEAIDILVDSFLHKECEVLGVIVNRSRSEDAHNILVQLRAKLNLDQPLLGVMHENEILSSPTVAEIAEQLDAEVLFGHEQLSNQVLRYSIAAMQPLNYLARMTEKCLVITPGDRHDIILTVLQGHLSKNYPQVSGILLSTGLKIDPALEALIDGVANIIPILSVKSNTYETSANLKEVKTQLSLKNRNKIEVGLYDFDKYIDTKFLEQRIFDVKTYGMTPRMFQYILTERAKKVKKHIVLPEGEDRRVLLATSILVQKDIVSITLLGNPDLIYNNAAALNIDLEALGVNIIQPTQSKSFKKYVNTYYELRKHKGANLDVAKDTMADVSYFGTMMVHNGDADGMVSGAMHTTGHTIRPALQFIKTQPGVSVVSSVFFMCLEDRVLVYGDCAINPNPDAKQLSEIAMASAKTARDFGIDPLVALLSYSSGSSGTGIDVDKVREATKIMEETKGLDFPFEGPIQYDAAVDMRVGQQKLPGSEVAGKATVLIFPDLNTGNNTYKAVQRETGAVAIGPILQGLRKPVNDLSRGCTVTDIVNTVIITAIQSS